MDDDDLTPEQEQQIESDLDRSLREPMPEELQNTLASMIEPHTMNMYLKHGDVMQCIDVAFPVIRDYLREHPEMS